MSDAQLNDVGQENALTRGDILAATAIAQFYNFASRCMDWAKTTRSLQERAVYAQMGLQWLAAGARLQTFLQFKSSQDVSRKAATQNNDLNVPERGTLDRTERFCSGRIAPTGRE
jgi:hypothetical protein